MKWLQHRLWLLTWDTAYSIVVWRIRRAFRRHTWARGSGIMANPCQMPRRFLPFWPRAWRAVTRNPICGRPVGAPHWSHRYRPSPFVSVPPVPDAYLRTDAWPVDEEHVHTSAAALAVELAADAERTEAEARADVAALFARKRGA